MKKLSSRALSLLVLILFAGSFIYSQDAQQGLTSAELSSLTKESNSKKRAAKAIKLADKKAGQARKFARQGDATGAAHAAKGYEAALAQALQGIDDPSAQGKDFPDTLMKVSEATAKHQDTLIAVLASAPEQAKPHVESALGASLKGHARALNALGGAAGAQENPQKQAQYFLGVANGRAAQMRFAADRGDHQTVQGAGQAYARALNNTMSAVNKAQREGANPAGTLGRVASATKKHQETLGEVLERVPENARAAIEQAMQVSQRGHQMAVARLEKMQRAGASGQGGRRVSPGGAGGARGVGRTGTSGAAEGLGGVPGGWGRGPR